MTDLILPGRPAASITSAQIADLVEARHDSVKRTIERLVATGVIAFPPLVEKSSTGGRPGSEHVFTGERGKRDSIVVVAQLSPEFTARLVDRWQELEARSQQPAIPQTLPEALRLAADLAEQNAAQAALIHEQAPKVAALKRFAEHDGKHNIRDTAKLLGIREKLLIPWMIAHDWIYRDHSGLLHSKADRQGDGYMDTRPVTIMRSTGVHTISQALVTQLGLTRLAVMLARDGLLPKREDVTNASLRFDPAPPRRRDVGRGG